MKTLKTVEILNQWFYQKTGLSFRSSTELFTIDGAQSKAFIVECEKSDKTGKIINRRISIYNFKNKKIIRGAWFPEADYELRKRNAIEHLREIVRQNAQIQKFGFAFSTPYGDSPEETWNNLIKYIKS